MLLPDSLPLARRLTSDRLLNLIQLGDALQRLLGNGGALCQMDIKKLAPDMRQAGDFPDPSVAGEVFEPGIAIRMQPVLEIPEVKPRPLALAILGEAIPG